MNDPHLALERAKASLARELGLPRHVLNETALEYDRLRLLRDEWPQAGAEPGSLLDSFCRAVEGDAPAAAPQGDELAARYRRLFDDPPPYPWHRGQTAAEATPAST